MIAPMAPHIASEMWKGIYRNTLFIDVAGQKKSKKLAEISLIMCYLSLFSASILSPFVIIPKQT